MKKNKIPKIPKPKALKIKKGRKLLCYREIIYRSSNRTKIFGFSEKFQLIAITIFLIITTISGYGYYYYGKSGNMVDKAKQELQEAKDAYENFVSEVALLQKQSNTNKSIDKKLKEVLSEDHISESTLTSKVELKEAILQRDMARAEVKALNAQIDEIDKIFKQTKKAELELLDEVDKIASKEVVKIKETLNSINKPLRQKGLYFNILRNQNSAGKGGPYIPDRQYIAPDKDIDKKLSSILETINNIDNYKEGIKNVPVGKPVWSYWVSSPFGRRNDPLAGGRATHKGIDLASRTGNKIKVKAKGIVLRAQYNGGYGKFVEVDHLNGFKTKYGHLNKIYVKAGDEVDIDTILGEVGNTGRSTGPHLHYEVLYQGHPVNPINFIKAKY
ncbi:MAG: M23 family metallopeptidase [Alphaproteobacteria bacterium]